MMCIKISIAVLLSVVLHVPFIGARAWAVCDETCARAPQQPGKRFDVVPLGYPYGNDWHGGPYLGPYAGPYREQSGWPFTFGYDSLWGRERVH